MLQRAVLCYTALCCTGLYWAILYCAVRHCAGLNCAVLRCAVQFYYLLLCAVLRRTYLVSFHRQNFIIILKNFTNWTSDLWNKNELEPSLDIVIQRAVSFTGYRGMDGVTKICKNLGYFTKQIENNFLFAVLFLSVIETFTTPFQPEKYQKNTRKKFRVSARYFMWLKWSHSFFCRSRKTFAQFCFC